MPLMNYPVYDSVHMGVLSASYVVTNTKRNKHNQSLLQFLRRKQMHQKKGLLAFNLNNYCDMQPNVKGFSPYIAQA